MTSTDVEETTEGYSPADGDGNRVAPNSHLSRQCLDVEITLAMYCQVEYC
jgi:hypothetical protein